MLGFGVGIIVLGMMKLYYLYRDYGLARFNKKIKPIVGFALMMVLFIFVYSIDPDIYLLTGSTFTGFISNIIENPADFLISNLVMILIIQFLATTFIIASGFPGGIFAPSLSLGAIMGLIFAILININDPLQLSAFAIVGMSSAHTATTKTPIASVLLILEITGLPHLIIPIVVANISAYMISGHLSLYEGQLKSRDLKLIKALESHDQLAEIRIRDVMTGMESLIYTESDTLVTKMKEKILSIPQRTFPVIENMRIVGIVSLEDINKALDKTDIKETLTISDIMTRDVITINADERAHVAYHKFLNYNVERCPVVDEDGDITGIVTMKDILRGHKKRRDLYFDKK